MSAALRPVATAPGAQAPCLEVSTVRSDALRASIRVTGTLSARSCPLLLGVLTTHVRAGRRYLRVDLADADLDLDATLAHLTDAHLMLADAGGMLVFDNAAPSLVGALRAAEVMVVPAG